MVFSIRYLFMSNLPVNSSIINKKCKNINTHIVIVIDLSFQLYLLINNLKENANIKHIDVLF